MSQTVISRRLAFANIENPYPEPSFLFKWKYASHAAFISFGPFSLVSQIYAGSTFVQKKDKGSGTVLVLVDKQVLII